MENAKIFTETTLFILRNLDFLLYVYSLVSLFLLIMFFYLLFKIKSLLTEIEANTRSNRKKVQPYREVTPIIEDSESKDWICPGCSNINDSHVYKCKSCGYSLT